MTTFSPPLDLLFRGPRGVAVDVANPYRDEDAALDLPGAARRRRRHFEAYLERVGVPRLVLLGEEIGYRGGRFSGIPFTSERQLVGDARVRLPWAGAPRFQATSRNPALWLEPSGSVVWGALGGDAHGVLLWNAFPWHPYGPAGPLSNRTPERALLLANLRVLDRLLAALPAGAQVAAVGRTAEAALRALDAFGGADPLVVRHPAHGGAALFRAQAAALLAARECEKSC